MSIISKILVLQIYEDGDFTLYFRQFSLKISTISSKYLNQLLSHEPLVQNVTISSHSDKSTYSGKPEKFSKTHAIQVSDPKKVMGNKYHLKLNLLLYSR